MMFEVWPSSHGAVVAPLNHMLCVVVSSLNDQLMMNGSCTLPRHYCRIYSCHVTDVVRGRGANICQSSRVVQFAFLLLFICNVLLSSCVVVLLAAVRRQRGECIPRQSADAFAPFVRPVAWLFVLWPSKT